MQFDTCVVCKRKLPKGNRIDVCWTCDSFFKWKYPKGNRIAIRRIRDFWEKITNSIKFRRLK